MKANESNLYFLALNSASEKTKKKTVTNEKWA